MTIDLTPYEAQCLMHAADNIMEAEDAETQLQFFLSKRAYNAAWRAKEKLDKLAYRRPKPRNNRATRA